MLLGAVDYYSLYVLLLSDNIMNCLCQDLALFQNCLQHQKCSCSLLHLVLMNMKSSCDIARPSRHDTRRHLSIRRSGVGHVLRHVSNRVAAASARSRRGTLLTGQVPSIEQDKRCPFDLPLYTASMKFKKQLIKRNYYSQHELHALPHVKLATK